MMHVLIKIAAPLLILTMPAAGHGEEVDGRRIHEALRKIRGEFENCHLVLATRGDWTSMAGAATTTRRVVFSDVWMVGDHVQAREVEGGAGGSGPWWDGFSGLSKPLKTATLETVEGHKFCARAEGDILWADFISMPVGRRWQYPSLYSTSRSKRSVGPWFVPFLEMDRRWNPHPLSGGWPTASHVVQEPPEKWRVAGRELLDGVRTVKVEIDQQESVPISLKLHEGTLALTPLWVCWFSEDQGYVPLKIENSMRYRYLGKDYPYERAAGMESSKVYRSNDIVLLAGDVWFPMSGTQRSYVGDPKTTLPFDPDRVVAELISKGKYVDVQKYVLNTEKEWRVLKLEKVSANLETWFDPPRGSCIRDLETKSFRIVGKSPIDSSIQLAIGDLGGVDRPSFVAAIYAFIMAGLVGTYVWSRRNRQRGAETTDKVSAP